MELKSPKGILQYARIFLLYLRAFPRCERKPFSVILKWHKKGKADIWYFSDERGFLGFSTTINGEREILVDYLAVNEKRRSSGNGTKMIQSLIDHYSPLGLFLEIEMLDEKAQNYDERVRRRRFYLSAGLEPLDTYAKLFGVDMELLGVRCTMDFEKYHNFYLENYSRFAYDNIKRI